MLGSTSDDSNLAVWLSAHTKTYTMKHRQIYQLAEKYRDHLTAIGTKGQRQDTSRAFIPTRDQSLAHALWMCETILDHLGHGLTSKAERWLCFVQGVLWVTGLSSIDSMRDDNR